MEPKMSRPYSWNNIFYLSIGFVCGILFLSSCTGSSVAIADYLGQASEIIFDTSTSSLNTENVQLAIEEVNAKAEVNSSSVSAVQSQATTNANAIATINSRQRLSDSATTSLAITLYNADVATGLSLNAEGRNRDVMLTASINVNNTVNDTPSDASVTLAIRVNNVVRQSSTVTLKAGSQQIITLTWLERDLQTGTNVINVIVNATNRINLENRYLYAIEL